MNAFVIAARRTSVAPWNGALAALQPEDLATAPIRACLHDAGVQPDEVDELIAANSIGEGGNPARLMALAAGLPEHVPGMSVDRQCVGGLDAILTASALVEAGQANVVLAGGSESYSRRPKRFRTDPAGGDAMAYDQARFTPWPDRDPDMAEAADRLACELGISRQDQDEWAVNSHAKARAAIDRLRAEISNPKGIDIDGDAFTRRLTMSGASRAPVTTGDITAANSSVAADGAAFCLVVSEKVAQKHDGPVARILGGATRGADPTLPGLAPVAAICEAFGHTGLGPDDMDVIEIMEAYAAQAIATVDGSGLDPSRVNQGGGSLARGHPIGASGAILAVRLFSELTRKPSGTATGLAAIAAAGGLGTALILRRV